MPPVPLRSPWVWIVIAVAALLIAFMLIPAGSDDAIERPLSEFIEDAKAGRVRSVEIDDTELDYKLIDSEQEFSTEMEEGDTLREVLQDAGIEPEEFPPIRIKEDSLLSRIPGLIFTFLPIIVITGVLYLFIRAARGGGAGKTRDVDPVCGKRVGAGDAAGTSTFQDLSYRFCSSECKRQFDADPVGYLLKT